MLSKEEINRVNEILSCDNCPTSYACEGCDITQNDKLLIKKYISELQQEIDEMANHIANLDVEEDICKKVEKPLCKNKTSVPVSYCIECVKQYFERKADKENG